MKHLLIITAAIILAFAACKKEEDPVPPSHIVRYEVTYSKKGMEICYYNENKQLMVRNDSTNSWSYEYVKEPGNRVYLWAKGKSNQSNIHLTIYYNGNIIRDTTAIGTTAYPQAGMNDTIHD